MTKEQIKVVIRVLKENIEKNEELLEDTSSLGKVAIDAIKFESTACVKAMKVLEAIGGVENE